ncbi:IS1380 family transposase, partial [Agathobacter sp. LCP21S3_B2]
GRAPRQKRDVKRRRLHTVISNLIMMACHITSHARQLIVGLGKSNVWRHIFADFCELCSQ